MREILFAIGENPDRDGLLRTPRRVAEMYAEICSGLQEDPAQHLVVTFEANHDEMVLVRDIPLYSDLRAPPRRRSTVGRTSRTSRATTAGSPACRSSRGLVDGFAKRPQVQERLTTQIADAIVDALAAPRRVRDDRGRAPLHVDARRAQAGTLTVTSAVRGLFKDSPATRAEVMALLGPSIGRS